MNGSKRVAYLDILRIVACVAVIFIHFETYMYRNGEFMSGRYLVSIFMDSASRFSVPVFMMISGALLLKKDIPFSVIIRKYVLKMALILVAWNIIYALYYKDVSLISLLLGHFHLWYLYVLIGIYLILPFLKVITDKKGNQFLLLALICAIIIPNCLTVLESFGFGHVDGLREFVDKFQICLPAGYAFYFVLGHYASSYDIEDKIWVYIGGAAGILTTFLLTYGSSLYGGKTNEIFFGYLNLNCALSALFVFCLVKKLFRKREEHAFISFLADKTFGIYLIHVLIMDILLKYTNIKNELMCLIVFVVSALIISVAKKVPLLNKIV